MTYNIEYEADRQLDIPYEEIISSVIEEACNYVDCPYEVCVNVLITDNEEIHAINKEHRDVDRPTDVLSFPMLWYDEPGVFDDNNITDDCFDPDSGELILGDIVLSVDKIYEQAESYGHSTKRELAFLVAHSMLHLFGYDHMEEDEREVMECKQREILDNLGITRD